jgi:hypothetical protein
MRGAIVSADASGLLRGHVKRATGAVEVSQRLPTLRHPGWAPFFDERYSRRIYLLSLESLVFMRFQRVVWAQALLSLSIPFGVTQQ